MALKVNAGATQYDYGAIEAALQRVKNALGADSVFALELFFRAVQKTQFELDFYPPERAGSTPFEFATDKQRRYFWWAVSQGKIKVPYQRTNRLKEATTLQVLKAEPSRFVIAVTVDVTKARYANYVIGTRQLPGHKTTGWNQLYTSVKDAMPGLSKQIQPAYVSELRGYLKAGF